MKIGEWIEIHSKPKQSLEIVLLENQKFKRVSFNASCEAITKDEELPWHLEKFYSKSIPDIDNWSDDDLKKSVSSGGNGLIYYWSPKFTYSVVDLPRVEALAKKLGLQFIPVVDPRAESHEITASLEVVFKKNDKAKKNRSLASKYNVNRNVSLDIYMRNGFNHFPVSFIYSNKKIHPRFITGVMTDEGEANLVKTYLSELKVGNK